MTQDKPTINTHVPADRIRESNDAPLQEQGSHVLYWMVSARRTRDNFALQRALRWARDLGKPLVVFEAVRCDYRWASDRLHSFILNGMRDNAHTFAEYGIRYIPLSPLRKQVRTRSGRSQSKPPSSSQMNS